MLDLASYDIPVEREPSLLKREFKSSHNENLQKSIAIRKLKQQSIKTIFHAQKLRFQFLTTSTYSKRKKLIIFLIPAT